MSNLDIPTVKPSDSWKGCKRNLLRDRSRTRKVWLSISGSLAALVLVACSSSGGEGEPFTVALIEPDITSVPLMAAVESMKEQGFNVKTVELAEPELAIEGLAQGTYAISGEATSPALVAMEQGAPIKIIADVIKNQWAVYGNESMETCNDLIGEPVGIFSEGAVATAMVKQWVSQSCDGGEPQYLVIGGSDVRAQALLAGQISGTALEVSDVIALEEIGASVNLIIDFAQALPNLHPQTVYANSEFLENHPEEAQAFIDALIEEHEKINADYQYLVDIAVEHLDVDADETLIKTADRFVSDGYFDAGGLTQSGLEGTIQFFKDAGVINSITVDDAADLSFLE